MKKESLTTQQVKFLKTVGKNIKKYRKKKGLSQQELGYLCNMDKPHISRAESGAHNFSILTALRFSEALEIKANKLLES